jgi:hypothetical protein
MKTIKITKTDTPVLPGLNFLTSEFWTPAGRDFELYECMPLALQAFRDWFTELYGSPVKWHVTSTFRPWDDPKLPEAHRVPPPAVDSVSMDTNLWPWVVKIIRKELQNWQTSTLVEKVVTTGCNIIIIEGGCLHIHYRTYKLHIIKKFPQGIYLGEWSRPNNNIAYSFDDRKS